MATGRRVVAANSAPCGACPACVRGEETLCENRPFLNGAYAEYVLVPERIAERNMLPCSGCAARARRRDGRAARVLPARSRAAEIEAGQTVAVLGLGPIGLMLCAARQGRGRARGRGRRATRAPRARPRLRRGLDDGEGADVVIEAAGSELAWRDAVELVRKGGVVLFFGGRERGSELAVDTYRLHYEELTLRGAFHHAPRHVRAALAFLASGAYPWERLVTHRVGLAEVPELFEDPPADLLKAAVDPTA